MLNDGHDVDTVLAKRVVTLMGDRDGWETVRRVPECLDDELHVWRADLNIDADRVGELEHLLDRVEGRRASRFRFLHDRRAFVASHGILRDILGRYMHRRPDTLTFQHGECGKPFVDSSETREVHRFNMSHTRDVVAIVVARRRDVGIDVERIREDVTADDLLPVTRLAAQLRIGSVETTSPASETLFRRWTRTEACLKAAGVGLSADVKSLQVFDPEVAGAGGPLGGIGVGGWQLWDIRPWPGCAGAVAAAADDVELKVKLFEYYGLQAHEGH